MTPIENIKARIETMSCDELDKRFRRLGGKHDDQSKAKLIRTLIGECLDNSKRADELALKLGVPTGAKADQDLKVSAARVARIALGVSIIALVVAAGSLGVAAWQAFRSPLPNPPADASKQP